MGHGSASPEEFLRTLLLQLLKPRVSIRQIQPVDFSQWASEQPSALVVLDVREAWELGLAKLAPEGIRLIHIPMMQIPQSLGQLPTDAPIAVLCHHGVRSLRVAHYLADQGFTQVYNIAGGIDAWAAQVDPRIGVY